MGKKAEIVRRSDGDLATGGTVAAIEAWAKDRTDAKSQRRSDLIRDKSRNVADFLGFIGKPPGEATPADVHAWREDLEARHIRNGNRGYAPATIANMVSMVSSFYTWARKIEGLAEPLPVNPTIGARPKAPKAYASESTSSIDNQEQAALIAVVKAKADSGSLVGKRDYALLLHYMLTGRRRAEVIRLRRRDIKTNGIMVIKYHVKGGDTETRPIEAEQVKVAMLDYLEASGRPWESLKPKDPIWTRHDLAGKPGKPLTSHAFAKNLKRYAAEAGLQTEGEGAFHLHSLRHTFGRRAADLTHSMAEVQELLGHKNLSTTRVYVRRVGLMRDQVSKDMAEELGLK